MPNPEAIDADDDPEEVQSAPSTPVNDEDTIDAVPTGTPPTPGEQFVNRTIAAPAIGTASQAPAAQAPANAEEARTAGFAAGQEGVQAAQERANAIQEEGGVSARAADEQAELARQHAVDFQADELARKEAKDEYNKRAVDAAEKVKNFQLHDYFDNPAHISKARASIAVFLGGLGNLGGQNPGAQNQALEALHFNIKQDHEDQLAYLNSAKYFADKQREGVEDLAGQQKQDRQDAELDFANKKLAIADRFASEASSARNKQAYDAAMIEVAKLKKSAFDDQQKVFKEIEDEKLTKAREALALAKAQKAGRHGTGVGASNDDKYAQLTHAIAEGKTGPDGTNVPLTHDEVIAKARALRLPLVGKPSQATADKAEREAIFTGKAAAQASAATAKAAELPKDTVYVDNKPIGLAPSGRGGAAAFGAQILKYQDSLRSLDELLGYMKEHPVESAITGQLGDRYHRAVLAVAATTSAPQTDRTTQHEADTLKNFKLLSRDAIQRTRDHIQERFNDFKGQLRPLPKSATAPERSEKAQKIHDQIIKLGGVEVP